MRSLLFLLLWPFLGVAQSNPASSPVCGNGRVESGEECDDGNQDNYDACLTSCKVRGMTDAGGVENPNYKDPDIAFRRALVATLFFPPGAGLVFGPSMGRFYAGQQGAGVALSLLRGGLVAGSLAITSATTKGKLSPGAGVTLLSLDVTLLGILIGADILAAPKVAARANKALTK